MAKNIRFKRGNKSNLPNSAPSGTPLWCEDTEELYIGTGNGTSKVGGNSVSEALVNQKLNNYVPKTQIATKEQKGIVQIGDNLAIRDGVASGIPLVNGSNITISRSLKTVLSINKSNPNMTVTHSYNGTKNSAGTEQVNLTIKKYGEIGVIGVTDPLGLWVAYNYLIIGGKLYYYTPSTNTLSQITNFDDWNYLSSRFAIRANGLLYLLTDATATRVGTYTDWKMVSGTLGIRKNGTLHHLIISSVSTSQIGTDTDWAFIGSGNIGNDSSSSNNSFGIKTNGQLYVVVASSTAKLIDSNTDWVWTSGWAFGTADYAFCVRKNVGVYSVAYSNSSATIEQRSTISNWKEIHGYSYGNYNYAWGVTEDGGAYYLGYSSAPRKISEITNAKTIVGTAENTSGYCQCLTKDGKLYKLSLYSTTVTCTQLEYNDWNEIYNASGDNCFGIRAGALYYISDTTITRICSIGYDVLKDNTVVDIKDYNINISGNIQNGDTITLNYDTFYIDIISQKSPYIVSQTSSGAYHCRIWSNKFCEQWSQYAGSGKSGTVTLPQPYADTNYVITSGEQGSGTSTDTEGVDFVCLFSNLTTSTFRYSSANNRPFTWYTAGYIS